MLLVVAAALLSTPLGVWLLVDHAVMAGAMLVVAAGAQVRAAAAPQRWWAAIEAALVGALGLLGLAGLAMPVAVSWWWMGGFWIVVALCELLAGPARDDPLAMSLPVVLWLAFAGVVTLTLPYRLGTDLALCSVVFLLVAGLSLVARGVRLELAAHRARAGRPSRARRRWVRRTALAAQVVVLIVAVGGYAATVTVAAGFQQGQRSVADFYRPPSGSAPAAPGTVIRTEPVLAASAHGSGRRVLYWSQDKDGRPTVSSGMVWTPSQGSPQGRPILDWTHGTVGLDPQCAPSRRDLPLQSMTWINHALDRGWVVTASDYAGAGGTAGPDDGEAYFVLVGEGRDALNIARAARSMPGTGAGDQLTIFGASQGGGVALAAAQLAAAYTPELHLAGVAASAPAANVSLLLQDQAPDSVGSWWVGSMVVRSYARAYPATAPSALLSDAARLRLPETSQAICDSEPWLLLPRLVELTMLGTFFSHPPQSDPAWRQALAENRAPLMTPGVPVFLAQGLSDPLLLPKYTAGLVQRYCAAGTAVTTDWMRGVSHDGSVESGPAAIAWLADRVAGRPAPSSCADPLPVTPESAW